MIDNVAEMADVVRMSLKMMKYVKMKEKKKKNCMKKTTTKMLQNQEA